MTLQKPDYIFETSWEVCNRVGGIYAVLSTRAASMQAEHPDKVVFFGPDFGEHSDIYFKEDKTLLKGWRKDEGQKTKEFQVRVGRWQVPGNPIAVLLKFDALWPKKDEIYAWAWDKFQVQSHAAYGDYDESCLFGYATGMLMESLYEWLKVKGEGLKVKGDGIKVCAHANEWQTAFSIFYLRDHCPAIATLFTTHATSIGRSIAGNGKPLYDYFECYNGDQMAQELNMVSKHSAEKQAAHWADCFTTVSHTTARECKQLLDKAPDVETPNGFEPTYVPKGKAFDRKRAEAREALRRVASEQLGGVVPKNALFVGISGRLEWKNKGIDVFASALDKLAQKIYHSGQTEREVVAFVMVPYLDRAPARKFKVSAVFVPYYLDGHDPLFGMTYYDLLIGIDITVFPSYYEPWGYTPLESCAFHVPTITTSLTGFGEWASRQNAQFGVTVIERNDSNFDAVAEQVADTLLRFDRLCGEDKALAREEAAAVAKKADWKHFFTYYRQAYDFALQKAKARTQESKNNRKPRKKMKKSLFGALIALLLPLEAFACTNFLVGKDASADGSTIISYAADSYGMYGFLHFAPAADWPEGAMREVKDWDTGRPQGQIPQPAHTYKVIGNMNEHQVTIGETTWGGREELWDTVGIDYGSLIYIALERSKTAREAIECMISLVNEYGYASEGESFSIGDPDEVWIMDLIGKGAGQKGANWVAVRIPDNAISAHANQARITKLPSDKAKLTKEQKRLQKKLNCVCHGDWMWSKDLIAFAREKGFFAGADKDFNYQAAYAPFDFTALYVCETRVWSFFRHFHSGMDQYFDYATGATFVQTGGKDAGEPMPLWIVPEKKVSVQDVKECMRDEYQGTPLDITQGIDAGPWNSKLRFGSLGFKLKDEQDTSKVTQYWYERPTATQQTAWSYVAQMRKAPVGIFWFGVDDAACSCYVPMFSCLEHVPECFEEGNGDSYTFSPTSAWWTFNIVANWAYSKYSRMYPHIRELQQAWDDKFNTQIAGVEAQAADMNEADARAFLTNYSCAQAENVVADWQRLGIYLMTKFLDGQERKEENGQFKRNPYGNSCGPNRLPMPEPFLRLVAPQVTHE